MDLVQSVCREVLADCAQFDYRGEPAFRQWLFQVAENKVRDRLRFLGRAKRDRARVLELNSADAAALSCYASFCSPSQNAIAREELERIESAFDELDANYQEVILLSRVIGLSNEEIAAQINQTPHYTRTLLSRGLARLTTLLDVEPA
jgi:RNA polymerase sigma factor (sigma-70 family)